MTLRCAVTGAFGYSGKYITDRLLQRDCDVLTLTNRPAKRDPFGGRVAVAPLRFEQPDKLAESLQGVDILVNTYWVRFNHRGFSYAQAVRNTKVLFAAAAQAGVGRVVHVSITNPDAESTLEYFRGKAELESALSASQLDHSIVRPAVLYGGEDILINNIVWALRRFPAFPLFGDGSYRLRPIHVEDFADLVVAQTTEKGVHRLDAVGPEAYSYRELVCELRAALNLRSAIFPCPPRLGYLGGRVIGWLKRDVFITWDEVLGLMEGRLDVPGQGLGKTRLLDWATANADQLGKNYANELHRRRGR